MIRDFGKFLMLICFSLIESFRNLLGAAQFCVRVHEIINSQFGELKRPASKARKRRNIWIFRVFAKRPDGMHRRPKCDVIFE